MLQVAYEKGKPKWNNIMTNSIDLTNVYKIIVAMKLDTKLDPMYLGIAHD